MSDELDRLRAWAAGAHGPSPCWCEGDYDPRPAVLPLFDRVARAEALLRALAAESEEASFIAWDSDFGALCPFCQVVAGFRNAHGDGCPWPTVLSTYADHPAQADPNT